MSFGSPFARRRTNKERKKEQLEENVRRGKIGEDIATMEAASSAFLRGRMATIERTGRGSDHKVIESDLLLGKVKRTYLQEVKTGKANLSDLQRKTKRKHKNYKVRRQDTFPF